MLFKISLLQKTEYVGHISANTLFGAFLTAYSAVADLTDEMINDIVLSDLFEKNRLPIGVKNNLTEYEKPSKVKQVIVNRTMISRGIENNNPINATGFMGKYWEFYLSTKLLDKSRTENIVKIMLGFGLGKWRNTGKGRFEITDIEECHFPDTPHRICLSCFIPDDSLRNEDIVETGYMVRDAFATNGKKQQATTLLLTGTKLKTSNPVVGKHLFDANSKTYIHGQTITMGVK